MTGNVMEWCEEYFDKYKAYDQEDPEGPDYNFEEKHVMRGGAWCFTDRHCRLTNRGGAKDYESSYCSGFRLAMK